MLIELATSNAGKTEQAQKSAAGVLELRSRTGQEFSTLFDEDSIKAAVENQLHIPPEEPFKYALAISQLKMMKHAEELARREPEKAQSVIPLVTDSIAVSTDMDGQNFAINRDDLKKVPGFKEKVAMLTNLEEQLHFHGFASFTFPGDENIYTVPTYLDVNLNRPLLPNEFPTDPNRMKEIATGFEAGFLRLTETSPDADFQDTRVTTTSGENWNEASANRHEPARQYMGGTTYGLMRLIESMSSMEPEKRTGFDGKIGDGVTVPFVTINRQAYANVVAGLPSPQSSAK